MVRDDTAEEIMTRPAGMAKAPILCRFLVIRGP
jgi:hypothetical protein